MAKLDIKTVRIDVDTGMLRLDVEFSDRVNIEGTGSEGTPPKARRVTAHETHWFVDGLAEQDETEFTHTLPAAWRTALSNLLAKLNTAIPKYI